MNVTAPRSNRMTFEKRRRCDVHLAARNHLVDVSFDLGIDAESVCLGHHYAGQPTRWP
jgi:hypothetical protein